MTTPAFAPQRVFISHSNRDKVLAERVVEILESKGVKCWISSRDIPPTSEWTEAIVSAIGSCGVFLFLLTDNSAHDSEFVRNELIEARDRKKKRFVIQYDNAQPGASIRLLINAGQWFPIDPANLSREMATAAQAIADQLAPVDETGFSAGAERVALPRGVSKRGRARFARFAFGMAFVGALIFLAWVAFFRDSLDADLLFAKGSAALAGGDSKTALKAWRKASAGGHRLASIALSKELLTGRYGDRGIKEGASVLAPWAKGTNKPLAEIWESIIKPLMDQADAGSVSTLRVLAAESIPAAEFALASYLSEQNLKNPEVLTFLKRAAEGGDVQAMREYGKAHFQGNIVPKDDRQAVEWLRRAAAAGDQLAQANLQEVESYLDAEKDLALANAGDAEAKTRVAVRLINLKGEPVRAVGLLQEAVAAGSTNAVTALAQCYLYGHGIKEDKQKAIELFKKAADLGDETARQLHAELTKSINP